MLYIYVLVIFYAIHHQGLVLQSHTCGISGNLQWLDNFVLNQKQYLAVNGAPLEWRDVISVLVVYCTIYFYCVCKSFVKCCR